MIRLALAAGFLAVFGLVGYAVILLLTNYFANKNNNDPNKNQNNEQQTK